MDGTLGDNSFNNDDFDLLCCDDENVAAVTKDHRSDKQPVCVQFSASARDAIQWTCFEFKLAVP